MWPFAMKIFETHILVSHCGFQCWSLSDNLVYQVMDESKELILGIILLWSQPFWACVLPNWWRQPLNPALSQMNPFQAFLLCFVKINKLNLFYVESLYVTRGSCMNLLPVLSTAKSYFQYELISKPSKYTI